MIIGNEFIEVFAEEARKLDGIEVPGAGHHLAGHPRIGGRHQGVPQCGRTAGRYEFRAGGAGSDSVQGRGSGN